MDHLSLEERRLIETVFLKYAHDFYNEETNDFKTTYVVERQIRVEDATPIRWQCNKMPVWRHHGC